MGFLGSGLTLYMVSSSRFTVYGVSRCRVHSVCQAGAICFRDDGKGSVDLDSNNVSNLRNLCCWC